MKRALMRTIWPVGIVVLFLSGVGIDGGGGKALSADKSRWILFTPRPVGIEPGNAAVVGELLRSELVKFDDVECLSANQIDKVAKEKGCFDEQCDAEIARTLGATMAVSCTLSVLGTKQILACELAEVGESLKVVHAAKLSTTRVEDLDTVARRVAGALYHRTDPLSEIRDVEHDLIADEKEEPSSKKALLLQGGYFGSMIPVSSSYGDVGHMFMLGWQGWYEMRNFALDFRAGTAFDHDPLKRAVELAGDFGLNYLFSSGDISPYVAAGIGLRAISVSRGRGIDSTNRFGFGVHGGGGASFFRVYNLRLLLDVRYRHLLDALDGEGAHGVALTLGLVFDRN